MLNKMKSVVVAALGGVALGAALFGAVPALAAGGGLGRTDLQADLAQAASAQNRTCAVYVDTDGDGICDICGITAGRTHHGCSNFVDGNGDGACDACTAGAGCRNGAGYVDADGDGVWDNREATPGTGRYNGSGTGYVDADGDGVCDNYGTGAGGGHHGHHARGHHGGGRC